MAVIGKVLVSACAVRFGELPDLLGMYPKLDYNSLRHEALGKRIVTRLGQCLYTVLCLCVC